jgi:lipoate-protein ligase A
MGGALRVTAKGLLYQGSLHVPGYSGDALEEGFVSWYPKTGDVRLRVALEREGILCPA